VTLGNARLELIRAGTDLATSEAGLARLVGETGRVRAADDSTFYRLETALDTAAVRAEAEAQSPRVRSAAASADAARAGLGAARSGYWPSLTLSANTSWNASRANDYDLLNQRQLSLGFRWNLFDRFDRELSIVQQSANLEVADATAADARREVSAALTGALAQLDAARSQIDITLTSVVAAGPATRVTSTAGCLRTTFTARSVIRRCSVTRRLRSEGRRTSTRSSTRRPRSRIAPAGSGSTR
jgi:outer membrane protein TolC